MMKHRKEVSIRKETLSDAIRLPCTYNESHCNVRKIAGKVGEKKVNLLHGNNLFKVIKSVVSFECIWKVGNGGTTEPTQERDGSNANDECGLVPIRDEIG